MPTIHLLLAEHFKTPGVVMSAHATDASARAEAAELVNIMLKDSGSTGTADASTWERHLAPLQEEHGAAHCYVEITRLDVKAATAEGIEAPEATNDTLSAARRLSWLCAELYHGNAFSKENLWRWHEDAQAAIAKAEGRS
ncbi:hypothetical protein V5F34_08550 [Xanthobacter autotrophicus]|uniref:hypothetical protein n=1 Tax=Xanthobacter autotrophicus TaxID=280 RepID=UPI0037261DCB